jgi:hypothetical protein
MTDKNYLEEFVAGLAGDLPKRLVETFVEGHRDPTTKPVDLVTRLKEQMEQALHGESDAPD